MKIYIPPQVKRLLFFLVIFMAIFILIKRQMVPDTFGDIGHYRAASLQDNEAQELVYAGREACVECHQDVAELIEYDLHSEISCETCHDAGYLHSQNPETVRIHVKSGREFCGLCHSMNAAKSSDVIFQIDLNDHYTEKDCIDCHNSHQPWELKE
jgi:hypothetical protein